MSRKLRFGMIGCGEIAYRANGPAIRDAKGASINLAMDPVEEVAKTFGEEFGCVHTTDAEEVFTNDEIDAVLISAPHFLHEPMTLRAAECGKHVVCEKPIACTLEQAERMIKACDKAGVKLSVLFAARYTASGTIAKEIVDSGVIGKVIGLDFLMVADKPDSYWTGGYTGRVTTDWRLSKEKAGGGLMIMNIIHNIDLMRYVTGIEPVRVSAEVDTFLTDAEVEDYVSASYRYDNGAIGSVLATSCGRGKGDSYTRILGSEGQMMIRRGKMELFTAREDTQYATGEWSELDIKTSGDPRSVLIEDFVKAVNGNGPAPIDGRDATRSLAAVLGAYEAGESGKVVELGV